VTKAAGASRQPRYEARADREIAETLVTAFGAVALVDIHVRLIYLRVAAKALSDGSLSLAAIALAYLRFPDLGAAGRRRLQKLGRAWKYNPNVAQEARNPEGEPDGGQWTHTEPADQTGRNPEHPWRDRSNVTFRNFIAGPDAERSTEASPESDGYGAVHRDPQGGAWGRYQLRRTAFQDIGWMDRDGNWTDAARAQGVTSFDDFSITEKRRRRRSICIWDGSNIRYLIFRWCYRILTAVEEAWYGI
jgi:hypothetical protein